MSSDFNPMFPRQGEIVFSFVDADNVKKGLEFFLRGKGVPDEHFRLFSLTSLLSQSQSNRYFVYSAVEAGKEPPEWISELRRQSRFIFRGSNLKVSGSRNKQEGVDVKIAVDAMQNAARRNMTRCCIYSDDGDLLPLVEALVGEGIETMCIGFNDPEKGDVASRIRDACDLYLKFDGESVFRSIEIKHMKRGGGSMDFASFQAKGVWEELKAGRNTFFAKVLENEEVVVPLHRDKCNVHFKSFRTKLGAELYSIVCGFDQEKKLRDL